MPNLNKVLLIGHLGRDAEVRYTQSGQCVIGFSLATTDKWKGKDGQMQERAEWHNISYFPKSEAVAQYLTKGKAVFVDGSLQTEEWTDKDGNKRKATKIKAHQVQLMGGGERGESAPRQTAPAVDHSAPLTDEDIPFMWAFPFLLPALLAVHGALA